MTIFPFIFNNSVLFMTRYLSFVSVFLLLFIVSCQKEESFEQGKVSSGSLQSSAGDCLSKLVAGTYTATKSLGDSNYIDVTVDVTEGGHYNVFTDTLNGYFFIATGTFTTIGSNTVRMKGVGTPGSAGTNDFTVFFDSSFCGVSVVVLPNSGGSGGTAVYTLQGTGGSCMNATPGGTFTQGVALTSANKISLQVNVTSPGTWSMTTSAVGGFSFSGSGTFTTTGLQTITLTGSGTPTAAGDQTFPVSIGTSSCSFVITVVPGTSAPNPDHLPLTPNSFWTYNDAFSTTATDTIKRVNNATATHNGNTYRVFTEYNNSGTIQWEYHFRKTGNDYFEYTAVDDYSVVTFDGSGVEGDILFLKEGLTTGTTWLSSEYSGTENNVNKKLRYSFTCTDANASITVNGKTYTDVYKITWKSQVSTSGGAFADEGLVWESYYAKGVGLVDMKVTFGTTTYEYKLRHYKVF